MLVKFAIVSRGDKRSDHLKQMIKQYLAKHHFEFHQENPSLVISIGGDGTFLEAFHRYAHRLDETAFIGVHTGHLGFYADWVPDEIDHLLSVIATQTYQVVEYPLLEVKIEYHDNKNLRRFLALNEVMIKTIESSIVLDVEINEEHFETFRGDGLCISTPSGSTAYNKALGGAIIHPSLEAIQLTEMASINNRVFRTIGSSLILPKHHTCVLNPKVNHRLLISIDHFSATHEQIQSIECRVAKEKIRFARYRPFTFWNRVRDSFVAEGHIDQEDIKE